MSKDKLVIKVKVVLRSSRSGVTGTYGDGLKVKLKSAPVEGKANSELIEILSKEFGISKKDVKIISGVRSKHKIVKLNRIKEIGSNYIKK